MVCERLPIVTSCVLVQIIPCFNIRYVDLNSGIVLLSRIDFCGGIYLGRELDGL